MSLQPARTYPEHVGAVLKLGAPLVGGHLAQFAITLTDTMMIGWYDVSALAGLVLGATLFFIVFLVGSGFAWAAMPIVAEASEADDVTTVRRTVQMSLWLSLGYAASMMVPLLFSGPIFQALGQEAVNADIAAEYLWIAAWGMFPALIVMVLRAYLSAMETTTVILWTTVFMAVANAALNWVLIFGNLGAPELGVRGAAIASVVTHAISIPLLIAYALRKFPAHRLRWQLARIDLAIGGRVIRLGVPIGLTSLAEMGMFSVGTLMMGWVGTIPLAAHAIAQLISATTFMIHMGVSQAATVRAGRALGRGDPDGLRRGAIAALAVALLWVVATMILLLGFPEPLIALFMDSAEPARGAVIATATIFLAAAALFQLADAGQMMGLSLLRGLQDTRVPMILAVVSYWVVGVPGSYLLAFQTNLGGVGIWLGQALALAVAALLLQVRFWRIVLPPILSGKRTASEASGKSIAQSDRQPAPVVIGRSAAELS